jgi:hypothetical protein
MEPSHSPVENVPSMIAAFPWGIRSPVTGVAVRVIESGVADGIEVVVGGMGLAVGSAPSQATMRIGNKTTQKKTFRILDIEIPLLILP